jgi:predicted ArsR family transcriptional regulator
VEELARAAALTANGVRIHLATLERDGWIRAVGVRRAPGPGKPATVYVLAPEAPALLSRAYRPLLLALLATLADREEPARVAALLREAGRRLATQLGGGAAGGTGKGERALRVLESLGAAAEIERGRPGAGGKARRLTIRGLGCPVGEAVSIEPRVCQAVSALLAGALDARVRDRCERTGTPRCRFEITPSATNSGRGQT